MKVKEREEENIPPVRDFDAKDVPKPEEDEYAELIRLLKEE